MTTPLRVEGMGMFTALGATDETTRGVRAGRRGTRETRLVGLDGHRLRAGLALPLLPEIQGELRMRALVSGVLADAARQPGPAGGRTALFVCASGPFERAVASRYDTFGSERPPLDDTGTMLRDVAAEELGRRGIAVHPDLRFVVSRGHAAGMIALRQAGRLLEAGRAERAFVVAAEVREQASLERLDALGLSRSRHAPWAKVPGEGAAALCVRGSAPGGGPVAMIRSHHQEAEGEEPSRGGGLTAAVERAIEASGLRPGEIRTVFLDTSGDREQAREWALACFRTLTRCGVRPTVIEPAALLGDNGAATAPIAIALAGTLLQSGAGLVVGGSRDGDRCAAVVSPPSVESMKGDGHRRNIPGGGSFLAGSRHDEEAR